MYRYLKETMQTEDQALKAFPEIDIEAVESFANALFTPYLFFKRKGDHMELRASCCMRGGRMDIPPRTVTTAEMEIMYGEHNDHATCPWCGKRVKLKNISHLGQKKNLNEFHRLVVLSEKDGDIYARAFWLNKDYQRKLEAPPTFYLAAAYKFADGQSAMMRPGWYTDKLDISVLKGGYDPKNRVITEPFYGSNSWLSYAVYNEEAIAQSRFRYCEYEQFQHRHYSARPNPEENRADLMKYLALCSIYPRQTEMLMKAGYADFVRDMVIGRVKNAGAVKWDAENPRELIRLTKTEQRELEESGAGIYAIEKYNHLKRAGIRTSFKEIKEICGELKNDDMQFFSLCRKHNTKPMRVLRYFSKFTGPRCHGMGYMDTKGVFELWKDYISFASELGWDIREESVLLPKDLEAKHNQASEERQRKLELEQAAKDAEKVKAAQKSLAKRRKKYNFELDGYFVRIAETPAEITLEGKTLKHCVGGYAYRHIEDKTTILFLRRSETPAASLYTIEMNGNKLVQIHGYGNDTQLPYEKKPQQVMKWFLDPWINWLNAGSKRDKDGKPIIKTEKEQKTA